MAPPMFHSGMMGTWQKLAGKGQLMETGRVFVGMKIRYPKRVEEIPAEKQEELERDIAHFSRLSPCERLRYVEQEWSALQDYIRRFGTIWSRKSN